MAKSKTLSDGTRPCSLCKETMPLASFYYSAKNKKYSNLCRACFGVASKRRPSQSPERKRQCSLVRLYGITAGDFDSLLTSQGGVCAVCKKKPSKPVLDHCHRSGTVRGILCSHCNLALGLMNDSPEVLRSAADYLDRQL